MKLVTVSDLFDVKYGVNLELNVLTECDSDSGIPFVSRTTSNNGISAYVLPIKNIKPNPAHTISVAGGGSVMESFYQKEPYYSGRDLFYLTPKEEMTDNEMLFYCTCLRANKYKYNYGRQANSTLKDLLIPDRSEIPEWVYTTQFEVPSDKPIISQDTPKIDTSTWKEFRYDEIFEISRGNSKYDETSIGNFEYPLIGASQNDNGCGGEYVSFYDYEGLFITVGNGGNTGCGQTFFQSGKFSAKSTANLLQLKTCTLNKYIAMFLVTLIKEEQYRYNFGRGWGLDRMRDSIIKLPVDSQGNPDWDYMENYIKTLPYSSSL
ncbi:MAG: restriction endonuclease subunit S [Brevinemataceae bacterium]